MELKILKSCPFCGGLNIKEVIEEDRDLEDYVICLNCDAIANNFESWNNRVCNFNSWIPIKQKTPPPFDKNKNFQYPVKIAGFQGWFQATYSFGVWKVSELMGCDYTVTHWLEMPEEL